MGSTSLATSSQSDRLHHLPTLHTIVVQAIDGRTGALSELPRGQVLVLPVAFCQLTRIIDFLMNPSESQREALRDMRGLCCMLMAAANTDLQQDRQLNYNIKYISVSFLFSFSHLGSILSSQ